VGGLVFALSLPLWPVAFGWSFIANAGHPTRRVVLSGSGPGSDSEGRPARRPFETFRFETAVPVLRDLPLARAVASGKLALQGVPPLSPEEEASLKEPWERVRLEAPPALLARSRLSVPASAPQEVPRLVDSFEARRGSGGLVGTALSALFSARAWTAQRVWNPDALPEGGS
jgi:hypothetical protein